MTVHDRAAFYQNKTEALRALLLSFWNIRNNVSASDTERLDIIMRQIEMFIRFDGNE